MRGQRDPRKSSMSRYYQRPSKDTISSHLILRNSVPVKDEEGLKPVYRRIEDGQEFFLARFQRSNRYYILKFEDGEWTCTCPEKEAIPRYIWMVKSFIVANLVDGQRIRRAADLMEVA